MVPAQCEHAPTGQEVEIPVAFLVVKPRSFAAHVSLVEPDGAQHFHENRIDVARVQIVLPPLLAVDPFEEVSGHPGSLVLTTRSRDVDNKESVTDFASKRVLSHPVRGKILTENPL